MINIGSGWELTPWSWILVCMAVGMIVMVIGGIYWLECRVEGRPRRRRLPRRDPGPLGPELERIP